MDFNQIWKTALTYYYLPPHVITWPHLTACAQYDVIITLEIVYQRVIDKAIKQWRTRLRACVKAKGGHFEHKL